jgi:NadR type nicotinamide-nucleotide adenylyltransferase
VVDDDWLAERRAVGLPTPFASLPHDDEPEDLHRRFTAWLSQGVLGVTCDAVFTSEDYGVGFAQVLAEIFGHPVTHVCVDKARSTIPVSATALRANASLRRNYLPACVAADLPLRVALLGAESTGKSTLAAALGARTGEPVAEEYGRELWVERDGALTFADMLTIAETQIAREDQLLEQASHMLICDTTPATTAFYSRKLFGQIAPELERMATRSYDFTFLCLPDIPFIQDGTRQNEAFRAEQHTYYEALLAHSGIAWAALAGGLEERLAKVEAVLASLSP